MRDDPLKNLAIVQAVRDIPKLYERETGIPKKELDRLWNVVGDKVQLTGMGARDRWRIIRGSYVRYLRAMETETAPKKEYYLAKYLEFVKPYLKPRDSLGRSNCTVYTVEAVKDEGARRSSRRSSPLKRASKRMKREDRKADEEADEEEGEQHDEQFVIEEEVDDGQVGSIFCSETDVSGTEALTYTFRDGQLVDSKLMTTSSAATAAAPVVVAKVSSYRTPLSRKNSKTPVAVAAATTPVQMPTPEEEKNPDLMFFKSLLPQMAHWTKKQKNKFKVAVLEAVDDVDGM